MGSALGLSNILSLPVFAGIAGLIVYDCRNDIRQLVSARNVFLLTIVAWYMTEACLGADQLGVFTQATYNRGLMYVVICVLAFVVSYASCQGGAFDFLFNRLAQIDSPRVLWGVFLAACGIGFGVLLYFAKGNPLLILEDAFLPKERWSGPFTRGRYGGWRDAVLELQMFLRAAIPLGAAILVHRAQTLDRRVVAAAFLVLMFARAYHSGTRSQVIEVFLPVAAAMYWRMSPAMKRSALMFGLPAFAILAMFWSAASVLGRNEGTPDWDRAADAEYVGFEMFRELLFISEAVPKQEKFKLGKTYFVQAINPIPRAIWKTKPVGDAGLELAKLKGMVAGGDAYLTVSPGMIGEMYWNFGLPGVVMISCLFGYLAKSWDHVRPLTNRSILAFTVFAAGLSIIFLSGRSINAATLYGMLALFALLLAFSRGGHAPDHNG